MTQTYQANKPHGQDEIIDDHYQLCIYCNNPMGAIRGSVDAICRKCGFKDGCCF